VNNHSIPLRQQTALESQYFLKNSVAIVSQKYQEFSTQVENRE
jgi:hypothetical protein